MGESQFSKWQWIDARIQKAPKDHRPESYKIDTDFLSRGETIPTGKNWSERISWVEPHIVGSFDELEERRQTSGETLGIIRPARIVGLDITPEKGADWSEDEKVILSQQGLFDTPEQMRRPPLRKLPYAFHYCYECESPAGTTQHKHKITDWEVGALFWKCQRSHGEKWQEPFRDKIERELPSKDLLLVMGTVHRFPNQWLVIGLIYPPRVEKQPTLF